MKMMRRGSTGITIQGITEADTAITPRICRNNWSEHKKYVYFYYLKITLLLQWQFLFYDFTWINSTKIHGMLESNCPMSFENLFKILPEVRQDRINKDIVVNLDDYHHYRLSSMHIRCESKKSECFFNSKRLQMLKRNVIYPKNLLDI